MFQGSKKRVLQKQVLPAFEREFGVQTDGVADPIAVLDIDGTLVQGCQPRLALIRWCNALPFDKVVVTARYARYYDEAYEELKKHGVHFSELIMMPDKIDKREDGATETFKADARDLLSKTFDIVLSVGDKWGDIQNPPTLAPGMESKKHCYFVGSGFIKLPDEFS